VFRVRRFVYVRPRKAVIVPRRDGVDRCLRRPLRRRTFGELSAYLVVGARSVLGQLWPGHGRCVFGLDLASSTRGVRSAQALRGDGETIGVTVVAAASMEVQEALSRRGETRSEIVGERPQMRTAGSGCSRRWVSTGVAR